MTPSIGIGIGLGRTGVGVGVGVTITGTAPVLGSLTAGAQLSTAVTWGSASTTSPPLTGPVREMQINGAAWVAYVGTRVVAAGEQFAIREVWSDARPSTRTFTSGTVAVPVAAPVNTVLPSVSGVAQVGQTLTGTEGTWTGSPTLVAQWLRAGAVIAGATGLSYVAQAADVGALISLRVTGTNAGGSVVATSAAVGPVVAAGAEVIGGVPVGASGAAGTYLAAYTLVDGDDFNSTTAADFLTPTNHTGVYMTTRNYGVQSGAPRYLRGSANLGGYNVDPWHTGFKDANRGVVPATYADSITWGNSAIKVKSRRALPAERAIMGDLTGKNNNSAMIHMGRRSMQMAPCIAEMRLRFPYELSTWDQWHPTFWLIQAQPGNGFDGLELDAEGFTPALQFNRNTWNNGVGSFGPTLGNTAPVSKTEYRTYSFEVVQVSSVWRVRLWENGSLVAEGSPDFGGNTFNPNRPFILMMTNHILQSGINQSVFDAAGDLGADFECDWWRVWRPTSTGAHRKPLVSGALYQTPFNTAFSFNLPTPAEVWGAGVTSDVIEMIPNEDNSPAQPWVRGLLPPSVTRTGNVLAGTIADQPGRLVLARSYTPAAGDGCVPQPITIAVGPRVLLGNQSFTPGQVVSLDLWPLCDCGDLHMGKTISVTGLAGSGLSFSPVTGLITGTAASGSYPITVTVTNQLGQTASASPTITVAAAPPANAYESWTGPGWFDMSDAATLTLTGSTINAVANKRAGGAALTSAGSTLPVVALSAQNGRDVARFARNASGFPTRFASGTNGGDTISQLFQGDDRPYTVISVYRPTDTNTGYIWSASDTVNGTDSQQIALLRRGSSQSSVRRQLVTATSNDVSFTAGGQIANTARIVAVTHTGTAVTVWDNSMTKAVNAVAQNTGAFNSELQFYIGAAETNGGTDPIFPGVACAMEFCEIVIEGTARSDVDVQQAITDLAIKWGIAIDGQIPTGQTAPTGMTFTPATVDENAPAGTTVGTFA